MLLCSSNGAVIQIRRDPRFARRVLHMDEGMYLRRQLVPPTIIFPSYDALCLPPPFDNLSLSMPRNFIAAFALLLSFQPAVADDVFTSRPAFSAPDQPPKRFATCDEVGPMSEGLPRSDNRIDFAVAGDLTMVKGDGALWYLVMCSDVRVMCVTYESNDMKAGERVFMRGGYRRLDDHHAVLDPCLASSEEPDLPPGG
jgi:hypothetical protein